MNININIGHSVTFPLEDRRWLPKLIVFLIVGFVPGLNLILWNGYGLSLARNLLRGKPDPLPDWKDWTGIAVRGLLSLSAALKYGALAMVIWLVLSVWRPGGLISVMMVMFMALYLLVAQFVLWVGHLRYAEADQALAYNQIGARLVDIQTNSRPLMALFGYQMAVTFFGWVFSFLMMVVLLFVLSALALINNLLVTIAATLMLAVGLLGYVAVMTLAFLVSGYLLGTIGAYVE
jgi:Protein of unknown function (DUF4013)